MFSTAFADHETKSLCHVVARWLLPRRLICNKKKALKDLAGEREKTAAALYAEACAHYRKEPLPEVVGAFAVHVGELDGQYRYYVVEYPTPAPVLPLDDKGRPRQGQLMGPLFSAVIEDVETGRLRYFVLVQAQDGGTTLSAVWHGMDRSLGRGSAPDLVLFLDLLRHRVAFLDTTKDCIGSEQLRWEPALVETNVNSHCNVLCIGFVAACAVQGLWGKAAGRWVGPGALGFLLGSLYGLIVVAAFAACFWPLAVGVWVLQACLVILGIRFARPLFERYNYLPPRRLP